MHGGYCKRVALLIIALCVIAGSATTHSRKLAYLSKQADISLLSSKKILTVTRVDTNSTIYAASVFITLNVPFEPTAQALMNFEGWPSIFKSIVKMEPVNQHAVYGEDPVEYYAEAKYSFVRGWGMGELKRLAYKPGSSVHCEVVPVGDQLFNRYLKRNTGVIPYHVRRMNVEGTLIRVNENQCRLGIFAWASVNKEIPTWLLESLMKIVMPSFVGDLERYVHREIKGIKVHR